MAPHTISTDNFFLLDDAVSSSSACWMRFWKKIKLLSLDDASPSSGKSGRVERNGNLESILCLKDINLRILVLVCCECGKKMN